MWNVIHKRLVMVQGWDLGCGDHGRKDDRIGPRTPIPIPPSILTDHGPRTMNPNPNNHDQDHEPQPNAHRTSNTLY